MTPFHSARAPRPGHLLRLALVAAGVATALPARPAQEGLTQRVRFARGRTSAAIEGAVVRGTRDRYLLEARAGQRMTVRITAPERNAVFTITEPRTGRPLPGTAEGADATRWSGRLPRTGTYTLSVGGTRGNAAYRLTVTIR